MATDTLHPNPGAAARFKEHPVRFKPEMVRAILAGEKTQTRRILSVPQTAYMNLNPKKMLVAWDRGVPYKSSVWSLDDVHLQVPTAHPDDGWEENPEHDTADRVRPRWKKGNQLWVKESHRRLQMASTTHGNGTEKGPWFTSDDSSDGTLDFPLVLFPGDNQPAGIEKLTDVYRYKNSPPNFMPRWASRIQLEITDVKIERLQDISQEDVLAEGATSSFLALWTGVINGERRAPKVDDYKRLWELTNGPDSWADNPWVIATTFRRLVPCALCSGTGKTKTFTQFRSAEGMSETLVTCIGCKGTGRGTQP